MTLSFTLTAWEQYTGWQTQDRDIIRRINSLIKDIERNGLMRGIGKPEPLKHRPGYSRRITDAHRLVYDGDGDDLIILSCRGHYSD
ncbi:MAG: Txe/YoeB family addiction module toxin [Synergistaceae bacterium]|nr:Txe/YoeB family addiction module toxin [Synergistaceae bacterium]